jgi:DNA polymerase IV
MIRGILHIDLDAFFVSVEQVIRPELKGKPVIVGGNPDRRGVVASASYEARAFGIHAAMPLMQAYRLCPQAVFLQGNFSKYREESDKFMKILSDFSPALEPGGLDEAYLDVAGCDIFGTPRQIAVSIKERVRKELQIVASVGISQAKIIAKIASDYGKPDGLVEVDPGKEKEFLAPLPVSRMPGIGDKTERVFRELGIKTIGELAAMKEAYLKSRFGSYGIVLHRYANGIDNRTVEMRGEAKSISRETTFAEDINDNRFIYGTLTYLCERVGKEMREQNKQARSISIKLRFSDFETLNRSRSFPELITSDSAIYQAAAALLDKALTAGKNKMVRLIGVEVSNLAGDGRQLTMFDQNPRRMEQMDRAIDKIREKYGFGVVQSGRTMVLRELFEPGDQGYSLHTPSLSR